MKEVYFIEDGRGHIKIGISENPASRLATLQTGSPLRLKLLCSFVGTDADERWLHCFFGDDRVVGEWFKASDDSLGLFVDFLRWWLGPSHSQYRVGPPYTIEEICAEWIESAGVGAGHRKLLYDPLSWADAAQVSGCA